MQDPRRVERQSFFVLQEPEDKIKFLLNYAVLAPSTHNSQPWLFKIENNSCKIYYDPKQAIKEADPVGRDLYISFGCLIENLVIAARYFRVFKDVRYHVLNEENLVGEVFFENLENRKQPSDIEPSLARIIAMIPKRVNARGIFEDKIVSEDIEKRISALNNFENLRLDLIKDKERIKNLAELTAEGLRMAYQSREFRKEMSGWINSSFSKRREGIPGYSLRMPQLLSLIFSKLVRYFNIGEKVGFLNYKSIISAPLVTILSAKNDNPTDWLETGRVAERMMLEMFAEGLKTSIFVASIEMGELYKEVKKVIGTNLRPQLLMCIGYMDFNQRPNLRHPVESKLIG